VDGREPRLPGRLSPAGTHGLAEPNERELEEPRVGEKPLDELGLVHPEIGQAPLAICPAIDVDQGRRTQP
jgi:hypothetical protein